MVLKRKTVDLSIERQILTGMIISDRFLREVLPLYTPDLFEIKYGPIIAKWCIRHFDKYENAPGILIQDIFTAWNRSNPNSEESKYIEGFLATLSEEYERSDKFNAPYLIDKTVEYFNARSFKLLEEDLRWCNENNDLEGAGKVLTEFRKVEKILTKGIDPFVDEDSIREAFEEKQKPLFTLSGTLGELMNPQFTRESFISLMGPEKRGKTFWLIHLAMNAHRQGCNVAFFSIGDMSEKEILRRQHIYLAKKSDKAKYCGELLIPELDCEKNQKDMCTIKKRACNFGCYDSDGNIMAYEDAIAYKPCTECRGEHKSQFKGAVWYDKRRPVRPLTWQEAFRTGEEYKKRNRTKGFKLVAFSSDSLSISQMDDQLSKWESEDGFIADVVVVDYIDNNATEDHSGTDTRQQENKKWKRARRLSQDRNVCLITATQSDAASYYLKNLTKSNFSEDKRKLAHTTAMYALNQTVEEKKIGVMRIASLVEREEDFDESYNVHVLQSLAIGRPYLESY